MIINVEGQTSHYSAVTIPFVQVKDELNYGLVFKGPGLGYQYSRQQIIGKNEFDYDFHFELSYVTTRSMRALGLHIAPLKFAYLFNHPATGRLLFGPSLTAEYDFRMYPDLQSMYSFWFSQFSLGARIRYPFSILNNDFIVLGNTSLIGLSSRPPVERSPYFAEVDFGHVMGNIHEGMTLESWNQYNVTDLEVQWRPEPASRIAIAYSFQYSVYSEDPKFKMIVHSAKMIIHPKSKSE